MLGLHFFSVLISVLTFVFFRISLGHVVLVLLVFVV